jgi:subtilisin-like proprotein convertase family protein
MTLTDRAMAAAPAAPPSCPVVNTTTFPNNTPKAIVDNGVTTPSVLNVSGGPTVINDVDLFTNIPHTNTGDLRITLTHNGKTALIADPSVGAGSGPGAVDAFDNVFAGTLWDDQSGDPLTEHNFQVDGPVSPLEPEGALAAFNGMDANGTWSLSVQDTDAGGTGTLENWSLTIAGQSQAAPATASTSTQGPAGAIPDNNPAGYSQSVTVTGKKYLQDVNLRTFITHPTSGDVDIFLTHLGKTIKISTGNGSNDVNVFNGKTFDDSAADAVTAADLSNPAITNLVPEEKLASFIGMDPNGVWTLKVVDTKADDIGNVSGWALDVASTDGCGGTTTTPTPTPGTGGTGGTTTPPLPKPSKLRPLSLGLGLSTKKDLKAPFTFTVTGRLGLPAGVRSCSGKVQVRAKAGKKVVASRTVKLKKKGAACTYTAPLSIKKLPTSLPKSGKVSVTARFLGNNSLIARASKVGSVRIK